jgi:hypothetical protein
VWAKAQLAQRNQSLLSYYRHADLGHIVHEYRAMHESKALSGYPEKVQKFQKIFWHTLIARLHSEENLGLFSG